MKQSNNNIFWIKVGSFSFLFLVILIYSAFQARKILEGPRISIISPRSGQVMEDPLLDIKGVATNVNQISLNGNLFYIDQKGNFDQKLLLSPGYNIISLDAKDKFGKQTEKKIEVVFRGNLTD